MVLPWPASLLWLLVGCIGLAAAKETPEGIRQIPVYHSDMNKGIDSMLTTFYSCGPIVFNQSVINLDPEMQEEHRRKAVKLTK